MISKVAQEKGGTNSVRFAGIKIVGFQKFVAFLEVEYVEYTVARHIADTFKRWIESCPQKQKSKLLSWFQERSLHIPNVVRYLIGLISVYAVWYVLPDHINTETNIVSSMRFGLLAGTAVYALYRIALHIGGVIERAIDCAGPVSYLNLTRGDKAVITEIEATHRNNMIVLIVGVAAAAAEAALAQVLVEWVLKLAHAI